VESSPALEIVSGNRDALLFAQDRRDTAAQQFDGTQELRLRQFGHIQLEGNPRNAAQGLAVPQDFFRHFLGIADEQRAVLAALGVEVRAIDGRPVALPADFGESFEIAREEFINGLFGCLGNVA